MSARNASGIKIKFRRQDDGTYLAIDLVSPSPTAIARVPRHGTAKFVRADRDPNPNVVATTFTHRGDNVTLKIRPKDGRFVIDVPAILGDTNHRKEIAFGRTNNCGLNPNFLLFLKNQLQTLVKRWKTLRTAQVWMQEITKRRQWRDTVVMKWCNKKSKGTRSEARQLEQVEQVDNTAVIPLPKPVLSKKPTPNAVFITTPGFPMPGRQHLMVSTQHTKSKSLKKPVVVVWVPQVLCARGVTRGRRVHMGNQFGADEEWQQYVVEYMQANARKWKNIKQARGWLSKHLPTFRTLVNLGWEHHLRENHGKKRVWRIAPSKLPICQEYIDAKHFSKDSEIGDGLWTEESGRHHIYYQGHPNWTRIADKSKETLTKQEGDYQVRADPTNEDLVEIPTKDAFTCCTLADAFMVNLLQDKYNPTHENRVIPGDELGRMYLHCRRDMGGRPGKPVEASADYHYELSREDKTRPDNSSRDPLQPAPEPPAPEPPIDRSGFWNGPEKISSDAHSFLLALSLTTAEFDTSNNDGPDEGFGDEPYAAVEGPTKTEAWHWLKPYFLSALPPYFKGKVNLTPHRMRFSLNRIEGGLGRHYDFAMHDQPDYDDPDDVLTEPGLSFIVHIGEGLKDLVQLEFTDARRTYDLYPTDNYMFPGYLVAHKTLRPPIGSGKYGSGKPRYSLVIFTKIFKKYRHEVTAFLREQLRFKTNPHVRVESPPRKKKRPPQPQPSTTPKKKGRRRKQYIPNQQEKFGQLVLASSLL